MRRLVNGLSLALVVASVTMITAGCGGLGDLERLLPPGTFGSGNNSPFIGSFKESSISANSTNAACPGTLTSGGVTYTCEAIVRLFEADGSFIDSSPLDQVGSGTWSVSGNNLIITKNGVVASYAAGFTPDQSQFVLTSGAETMTWVKQ